jgi:hypothetical protein
MLLTANNPPRLHLFIQRQYNILGELAEKLDSSTSLLRTEETFLGTFTSLEHALD